MKNKSVDYFSEFYWNIVCFFFFIIFIEVFDILIVLTCFANEVNSSIKKDYLYPFFLIDIKLPERMTYF